MKTIKVKSIIDGDTFVGEDKIHYRLVSVDAPETNQPGFNKCRTALEKLILNKELEILREQSNTSFGRPVVEVRVIGESDSVNKKMNIFLSK
ncbi:MAG: hypothetical protein Q8N21_03225 [bacterium]|nr:hypothetical protein [bacterium]